jgi:hypothetical protein
MASETIVKQSNCYLSTPEHVSSFFGRFIYIYTDKGELRLTESCLEFAARAESVWRFRSIQSKPSALATIRAGPSRSGSTTLSFVTNVKVPSGQRC